MNSLHRITLISLAVEELRNRIQQGQYRVALPGERPLSKDLKISRPTLRAALKILTQEQWISTHPNKRRLIFASSSKRRKLSGRTRSTMGVISRVPPAEYRPDMLAMIQNVESFLNRAGIDLHWYHLPERFSTSPDRLLARIHRENPCKAWLLISLPRPIQQWYSDHSIPALVIGSVFSGLNLPSIDFDYKAICRHAAGSFLAAGHRHLACIQRKHLLAGDLLGNEGLLEGARNQPNARVTFIRQEPSFHPMKKQLNQLLRQVNPPTAFLISEVPRTLTTLHQLLRQGLRVPDDLSIICRDYNPVLDFIEPHIAHFRPPQVQFSKRLCRLALELGETGKLKKSTHLLIPDYIAGNSVAAARPN